MMMISELQKRVSSEEQQMALDNCIVLFETGSHLYGTSTVLSDHDYEGIFIEPPSYVLGNKSCTEVNFSTGNDKSRNTSEDIDCKLYSLRKYLSLVQQNNPNKIEILFIPGKSLVFKKEKYWNNIVDNKDFFLSLKLKHSFSGYAKSQEHKLLTKKKRYEELISFREILKEGLERGCKLIGDLDLIEICECRKYHSENDTIGVHLVKKMKEKYSYIKYKKTIEGTDSISVDNKDYNFGMSLQKIYSYVDKEVKKYGGRLEYLKEYGFDLKFCSHLFRLYYEGLRLLKKGNLIFPMPENEIKFMMDIKSGKYSLNFLIEKSKKLEFLFEKAYQENKAKLPYSPNFVAIGKLQQDMILSYWKENNLV